MVTITDLASRKAMEGAQSGVLLLSYDLCVSKNKRNLNYVDCILSEVL